VLVMHECCKGCTYTLAKVFGLGMSVSVEIVWNKIKQSRYRPQWPRGFQEVKVPRFYDETGRW